MKGFGLRLESLREKYGYSKRDVSLMLGFTANVYGSYERETRRPALETIIKLADIYNVSLDYLIRGTEYQKGTIDNPDQEKVQNLLEIFAEKGIKQPYILQLEKWSILSQEEMLEINNHFEWVVYKSKNKRMST
ncbi:helix-turn-helix transcriptional regulator [Lentibacillus sp. N15]|uniref:helix-turn-helix domain-containing protein n=1 Tax=Lentibacillus songyuanensis TaxID=3136161 RepID=UPI0031BA9634